VKNVVSAKVTTSALQANENALTHNTVFVPLPYNPLLSSIVIVNRYNPLHVENVPKIELRSLLGLLFENIFLLKLSIKQVQVLQKVLPIANMERPHILLFYLDNLVYPY